jgi:hypothetical protein
MRLILFDRRRANPAQFISDECEADFDKAGERMYDGTKLVKRRKSTGRMQYAK